VPCRSGTVPIQAPGFVARTKTAPSGITQITTAIDLNGYAGYAARVNMLDTIEKLLILQDRDRKIRRLRSELAHIEPERQALKAKALSAQTQLEQAKTLVKQLESNRKNLELEVEAKKQLIERYANQQLQTRKNEEYRALAHEIETCKAEIFKIEDQEIALMEQGEAAQKEVQRATQAATEARLLAEQQVTQLGAREQNLQTDLAGLEANREELALAVDEISRGRYERLTRSKGENVVVGVQHGVCGGCHMKLPPQLLVMCQAEKELVTCSNCGRILYYTPDMDLAVVD
jgi:predicted  nucleic acid-binding Zn-ribbon protein